MARDVPVEVALTDKVAFLGAVESHVRERPGSIEALEPHMSWVFLTDRFAYKLKKPVCHALFDLRSLEARRRNCLVEVRLNRRLAPDVYLGVEPLIFAAGGGGLQLAGNGSAVDWLVVMRRPPETLMLDRVLRSGGPERRTSTGLPRGSRDSTKALRPSRSRPRRAATGIRVRSSSPGKHSAARSSPWTTLRSSG